MNTVQLECFIAVTEVLNFSKAAEILNVTQPAISHQITSLENELNIKLFIRDSKNVEISPAGLQFLPDAIKMIEIAKSSKTRLKNQMLPQLKTLEICCHNTFEANLLPDVLNQMQKEFPYLLPVIRMIPTQSASSFFENESIHVMLGYESPHIPAVGSYKELSKFQVSCVYSPSHVTKEFRQEESLSCKKLYGYILLTHPLKSPSVIRKMQADIVSAQGDSTDAYYHYCDSYASIITLVRSGFGMTATIDIPLCREPGLCYVPITDLKKISFGLYYKSHKNNQELKRFIELMEQLF